MLKRDDMIDDIARAGTPLQRGCRAGVLTLKLDNATAGVTDTGDAPGFRFGGGVAVFNNLRKVLFETGGLARSGHCGPLQGADMAEHFRIAEGYSRRNVMSRKYVADAPLTNYVLERPSEAIGNSPLNSEGRHASISLKLSLKRFIRRNHSGSGGVSPPNSSSETGVVANRARI